MNNEDKSIDYNELSKNLDNAFEKAMLAYKNDDYATTFPILSFLHDKGYEQAKLYLGYLYFKGSGVEKNIAIARQLFQDLAEQKDAPGAYYLASLLLESGDIDGAKNNFEDAANLGHPSAAYWAYQLHSGYRSPVSDKEKAEHYRSLAATLGHIVARRDLAKKELCEASGLAWLKALLWYWLIKISGLWSIIVDVQNTKHR